MECTPFNRERQDSRRERARQKPNRINPDLRFSVPVDGVKMRWSVIREIHSDHYTKESGDFRQVGSPRVEGVPVYLPLRNGHHRNTAAQS